MLICLNCGCSMCKENDTNCPVCNHVVFKESVGVLPFGDKHGEDNQPTTAHATDSAKNIR